MKKHVFTILALFLFSATLCAEDFSHLPSITPNYDNHRIQPGKSGSFGPYSTITMGGTTLDGEGEEIGGPRRAQWDGLSTPQEGDTWVDLDGTVYVYRNGEWVDQALLPNAGDHPEPIGSPIGPMFLFVAAAVAYRYLRRRCLSFKIIDSKKE